MTSISKGRSPAATSKETFASGQPGYDAPESGTLGSIKASSLENSNVSVVEELVNMIVAQRSYETNARTIKASSPACSRPAPSLLFWRRRACSTSPSVKRLSPRVTLTRTLACSSRVSCGT